jgi:hypothetical protein
MCQVSRSGWSPYNSATSDTSLHLWYFIHWYVLGTKSTCRPKQAKGFWQILVKLQKCWWLFAYTNLMTFHSPFYHIKLSKCLVFSVCPACYHPSPVSCVTFLSLIIFKIPQPCLLSFHCKSLFHISFYTDYYCFPTVSLLIHCLVVISWALASIIPIVYTPSHSIKDVPPSFIKNKEFTPTHIVSYKPSH